MSKSHTERYTSPGRDFGIAIPRGPLARFCGIRQTRDHQRKTLVAIAQALGQRTSSLLVSHALVDVDQCRDELGIVTEAT